MEKMLANLQKEIDEVIRANELLKIENEAYEGFLIHSMAELGVTSAPGSLPLQIRNSDVRQTAHEPMGLDDKYAVCAREVELLEADILQCNVSGGQSLLALKSLLEETNLRISEVKRDAFEFRRDVVIGGENSQSGHTAAEKVLRYYEDKLTQKEVSINSLLIKNQAYRLAIRRLEKKQASGGEGGAGESLQFIDFHQLQIENKQLLAKVEEANAQVAAAKERNGSSSSTQAGLKAAVARAETQLAALTADLTRKESSLRHLTADAEKAQGETAAYLAEMRRLDAQSRLAVDEIPQIGAYVQQKAQLHALEVRRKRLLVKLEIARMDQPRAK